MYGPSDKDLLFMACLIWEGWTEMTNAEILGALGVIVLCIIFGAMGLMEAYKPYDDEDEEAMIAVNEELPNLGNLRSTPVQFVVDGKEYEGIYHENGWFYSSGWILGKRGVDGMMAQGPKAECRMQTWDELPKHKATAWRVLMSNTD